MTREEFVGLVTAARRESGKSVRDIVFSLNILPPEVYRIESGRTSCSMQKYIDYLSGLGYVISLSHGQVSKDIITYEDLVAWERVARGKISRITLSFAIGRTKNYILNLERGRNIITVDNFLKIAEVTGWEIKLIKKEEEHGE